jgi:Tfp pilus assembly protein PilF
MEDLRPERSKRGSNDPQEYRKDILHLLDCVVGKKFDDAKAVMQEVAERFEETQIVDLIGLWSELRQKQTAAKKRKFYEAISASNAPPAQFTWMARSCLDVNDFDTARLLLDKAKEKGVQDYVTLPMFAKLGQRTGDHAAEKEHLEALCALQDPPPIHALNRLARLYEISGEYKMADGLLKQVFARDPDNISALNISARICTQTGDGNAATETYQKLYDLEPEQRVHLTRLLSNLCQLGREDEARVYVLEAFEIAKYVDLELAHAVIMVPLLAKERRKILECVNRQKEPMSAKDRAMAMRILYWLGEAVPSHLSLNQQEISVVPNDLAGTISILDAAPADADLKRPVVKREGLEEVSTAMMPGSKTIVFLFTGLADAVGFPIYVFDRYLAAMGVSAVYLRDRSHFVFGNGLSSVSSDFEGTVEHLNSIAEEIGAERIVTIGASVAGFPAIRYGLAMNVDAAIGFSAPTNMTVSFNAEADGRAIQLMKRLNTLPTEALELLPLIRAKEGRYTSVHIPFGSEMPQDVRHAEVLEGELGVTLHPIAGLDSHGAVEYLAVNNLLDSLLRQIILLDEDTG